MSVPLSIGTCATLSCQWEATAPKPGNVYRGADFEDVSYVDFLTSAVVIGPVIDQTTELGVGPTVLKAVQATRHTVATNTNLGTLLLIAPLAAIPREQSLGDGIDKILAGLGSQNAKSIYEAIRTAQPGGIGEVEEGDVNQTAEPELGIIEAMQLAANRDLVARQYTNAFDQVFNCSAAWLEEAIARGMGLADAIVFSHLRLMAEFPDSLIARKCGEEVAQESADRAAAVLQLASADYEQGVSNLDFWLRADGHRRNPGTTADLIAAGLFVLLREQRIEWPIKFYSQK